MLRFRFLPRKPFLCFEAFLRKNAAAAAKRTPKAGRTFAGAYHGTAVYFKKYKEEMWQTMKRVKALLCIVCALLLGTCFAFAACASKDTEEKATIGIGGQTADAQGEYSLTLEEGKSATYTLIVGTLTDYSFSVESSDAAKATGSVSGTQLSVSAVAEGEATLTVSEAAEKAHDLVIRVTVTAAEDPGENPGEEEDVTGVMISNTSSGTGTISDPYVVSMAESSTSSHNLVVRPTGANNAFTWEAGEIADDSFTTGGDAISATQAGAVLTIASTEQTGTFALRGTAQAGGFATYLRVNVTEYTRLEDIVADDLTEDDSEAYDYTFVTAKGTSWNMTDGMSGRGEAVAAGADGKTQYQVPVEGTVTYYASLYAITFTPVPAEASDTTWKVSYSEEGVFTLDPNAGTWSANAAGETVVTVTNVAEEAEITIKVTVEDTLYTGILSSSFEAAETSDKLGWNFDGFPATWSPEDAEEAVSLYSDWNLVMNKTTGDPDGSDGGQKFFYAGDPGRVYGIDAEMRIDSSTGVAANTGNTIALMWAKVNMPAQATTFSILIGTNTGNKDFLSYRVVFVAADGSVSDVSGGWIAKEEDGTGTTATYNIPDSAKGKTGALVIEYALTKANDNIEAIVKNIQIATYAAVESVTVNPDAASVGQGGQYTISASVMPAGATDKSLSYEVTAAPQDGNLTDVTVNSNGVVSVSPDAAVGEYTITVTSNDNAEASDTFTLTVTEYTPVTSFAGTLSVSGREIDYGAGGTLDGAQLSVSYDANGIYTDPALTFAPQFNEGASVVTYTVAVDGTGVVWNEGSSTFTFNAVGSAAVTITPTDNADLAIEFTVNVGAYSLIEGTNVTETSVGLLSADTRTSWNTNAQMHNFIFNLVDKSHGNAKFNYDGDVMQFESHTVTANNTNPVNIGYNYVSIGSDASVLAFNVHGHRDDRYLESSNFRVRVLSEEGGEWSAAELLGWTTVASRWTQQEEWFTVSVDVSAYQGKDVVILFEMTGGFQNGTGTYPNASDSSAGAYLYLGNIRLLAEAPEGSLVAEDGVAEDARLYAHDSLAATGWTVSANKLAGSYSEGKYAPLTLTYAGSLSEVTTIALTQTSFYSASAASSLYPWGVFPALNNSAAQDAQGVAYRSSNEEVFTVNGGVITPVANGTATLYVDAAAQAGGTVTFEAKIVVAAVEQSVTALEEARTIEPGDSYTLSYETVPVEAAVTMTVTQKPDGADESMYTLQEGVFTPAANAVLGTYVITIALEENGEISDTVSVTVANVTSWANKNAILDAYTGWKVNGSIDAGVGEGADLNSAGSYLSKAVDLTELTTLTLGARVFVRGGETDPVLYVAVVVDGEPVRIVEKTAGTETVTLDTTDPKYDSRNEYVYDLSAYTGKTVEIRIGIDQGTHCVITDAALS